MAEGDYYVNGIKVRSDGAVYTTTTANMDLLASSAGASLVGIADAANNFTNTTTTVEEALEELFGLIGLSPVNLQADLASTSDPTKGASMVGIYDAANNYSATTVETVLAEIADQLELSLENDFGAAGNGVADDTAEIQAAIASGAKTIKGTPGATYLLGAAGLQFASLTGVRFIGNGATLKFDAAATPTMTPFGSTMIVFSGCTNSGIEGWTIDGNSKATNAIGFDNCTECFADHNYISASGVNGQIVASGNTRNRYAFNTVLSSIGSARGIWAGNVASGDQEIDPLILGNVVRNNAASGIAGLRYGGRIIGNHCLSNAGAGIVESGDDTTGIIGHGVIIANNVCRSNVFHGIQLGDITGWDDENDSNYEITVSGNICELNTNSGIYAVQTRDTAVLCNICVNNGDNGITGGSVVRTCFYGNICYDSRVAGARTQDYGINVAAQTAALEIKDIIISGNICRNHVASGIDISTGGSGTLVGIDVSHNTSSDNSAAGIIVATAAVTRAMVIGNKCLGNGTADLRVDTIDALIANNLYVTESGTVQWTFTDLDTTPSVLGGRKLFRANNSVGTTITQLDNGRIGQELQILFANANTTINTGGNFGLKASLAPAPQDGIITLLTRDGTFWAEVSRSF